MPVSVPDNADNNCFFFFDDLLFVAAVTVGETGTLSAFTYRSESYVMKQARDGSVVLSGA